MAFEGTPRLIGFANKIKLLKQPFWIETSKRVKRDDPMNRFFEPGGGVIEKPKLVKRDKNYYLFFATGESGSASAEGVARSEILGGPYDICPRPVLSTGSVGYVSSEWGLLKKIFGPGHASIFVEGDTWYMVWYGLYIPGPTYFELKDKEDMVAVAFRSKLTWEDDWPRVADAWPRVA